MKEKLIIVSILFGIGAFGTPLASFFAEIIAILPSFKLSSKIGGILFCTIFIYLSVRTYQFYSDKSKSSNERIKHIINVALFIVDLASKEDKYETSDYHYAKKEIPEYIQRMIAITRQDERNEFASIYIGSINKEVYGITEKRIWQYAAASVSNYAMDNDMPNLQNYCDRLR